MIRVNIHLENSISIRCESTKKPPGTLAKKRGFAAGFMEMIGPGYKEFFRSNKVVLDETE